MTWLKKLFGGRQPDRVDYYEEGLDQLEKGDHHEALTSFRLALKESPGDPVILQQIAIAYTRIGMTDEAAETYRHVLQKDPDAPGAHYGLAFLLVRTGQTAEARPHLEAFLANPPSGPEAEVHISHARETFVRLTGSSVPMAAPDEEGGESSPSR